MRFLGFLTKDLYYYFYNTMTKNILLILLIVASIGVSAQLANWTGYNTGKFPTNQSGQIHGQARIAQIKFHPTNPNIFYAVTPQGGLFISNDQGTNWTHAAGTDAITAKCASICIDYTDDQILYLGGGDPNYYGSGAGIWKSTNGGATFTQLSGGGLPTSRLVDEIIMHPTDHNTLVAATSGGIYKSTNGGTTWTAKTATNLQFTDMKRVANATSLTLFATTLTTTGAFYRSTDFGDTWTLITTGLSAATVAPLDGGGRIAVTPADTNVVYFSMVASGGIIYKSTDNGLSFTVQKAGGSPYLTFYADDVNDSGQGNYNNCLGVDNLDPNKVWLQSHNTWYSSNGGVTWTKLTDWWEKVHTDMHQISKSPYDNTKLYSCNDGGVWLSTDEGISWTPKSDGIFAFEVTSLAGKSSPTRRDFVSIGTQDNGGLYGDSTGWYTVSGGDDYTPREIDKRSSGAAVYYIGRNGDFSVSNIGKRRLTPTASRTFYNSATDTIYGLAFNRMNINLAFLGNGKLGDGNIYRSINVQSATPTWTQISTFNKTIAAVHSCVADTNRLYVLTTDQKIYVSNNAMSATPTFTMYNLPTASNSRASIAAICNNADIVYISINNKVYRSADAGATWTDITYNLPSVNHRRILAEEYYGDEELVFVATNNAVYYKKAGQITWTNYSSGLPARQAPTDFSMYDDGSNQGLIRYTSYGRGLFQTPFDNLRTSRAVMSVKASNDVCSDATWNFKDVSIGAVSRTWSFPGATPSTSTAINPTVTYTSTGTYTVTLTILDALSNSYTTTYTLTVSDLNKCDADTITGNALQLNANTDYATIPAFNNTTNTLTLMAWIKPNGTQSATTGLIFSASGGATGMNLTTGGRLGYHWNNTAGSYNYASGPIVPVGVWSHVALVVTGTNATFYLNGVPTVRTASHAAVTFSSAFQLGRDRSDPNRNFIGKMDEVAIYDRALSTNEIREQMHLTKKPTTDPNLLAYFQMNEPSGTILLDHAHSYHGTLITNATRSVSTAPFGGGTSERQSITTGGVKTFNNVSAELTFPATGTYPNGDIVISKINISPDQKPSSNTTPTNGYWIVDNYGTNSTFSALTSLKFNNLPNIGTSGYLPAYFNIYKRSNIADGNTWGSSIDAADILTPNGQNAALTFSTGNNTTSFGQFAIENSATCISTAPSISITNPSTTNDSISICTGATVTLTPVSGAGAMTEYLWLRNGTVVNYINGGTGAYTIPTNTAGTDVYTLQVVYYGSICTSNAATSATVIKNTVATPVITTSTGLNSFCVGSPFTLTTTAGMNNYVWKKGNTTVGTNSNSFNPTSSGNYLVSVTNDKGCSKNSANISITQNSLPVASAGTDKNLCEGATVQIGANAATNCTYIWSPSVGLSAANISNPVATGIANTSYILTVNNTTTQCSRTDTINITVLPMPQTPSLSGTSSPVCQGISIVLTPNAPTASSVNWYKNGTLLYNKPTTNTVTLTAVSAATDVYDLKSKGANGCLSAFSNSVNAWIKEAAIPTITSVPAAVGTTITVCVPNGTSGSAELTANSTTPGATYSWRLAGAYILGANTNIYTAPVSITQNNKIYSVEASYSNGCVKTSANRTVKLLTTGCTPKLGTDKDDANTLLYTDLSVKLYPNPTSDILNVEVNNSVATEGTLMLYNAMGQIVWEKTILLENGKSQNVLDLSRFAEGTYMLTFHTTSEHIVQKVVKE